MANFTISGTVDLFDVVSISFLCDFMGCRYCVDWIVGVRGGGLC